jgi:hypothetical protein
VADDTRSSALGDVFDAAVRSLEGRPGVEKTKPSTLRVVHPVLSIAQTFIVQTYRESGEGEPARDTIFVEYMGANGTYRIVLPPQVADTIARQRDSLVSKNRVKAARAAATTRAARGIRPGFLRGKKAER